MTTPGTNSSLLPQDAVNGFWIGAISTMVASGISQIQKIQEGEISSKEAMIKSSKHALDGGIALGTASHATSQIIKNNWIGATGTIIAGAAAIYAVEKISETMIEKEDESCKAE